MNNINFFTNGKTLNNIEDKYSSIWIVLILLALSILIILGLKFEYNEYENYIGVVNYHNNNYVVKLYIVEEKLIGFNKSVLLLNNEIINYKIINISDKLYLSDSLKIGYEVTLNIHLNEEDKINNNVLKIKRKLEKTTFIKKIIKKIKKGLI